jgi:hypothetical protein
LGGSIDVFAKRLVNQGLVRPRCSNGAEIVSTLGAVQAQDYPGARWALGMRAPGLSDADIEAEFDAGAIVRTHVMRPTWHFVTPADLRWLQALTAPRVRRAMGYYHRQLDLDPKTITKSLRIIEKTLAGGRFASRAELSAALKRSGIEATGQRLAHIVVEAELDALVCSGPRRDKQFTYALVDERVPPAPARDREWALAELARRYFTSHGPATVKDFVWWSGLTTRETKEGLALAGDALDKAVIDGFECWFGAGAPVGRAAKRPASPHVFLLSNYDEIGIAYKDRGFTPILKRPAELRESYAFPHQLMIDGAWVGAWQRVPGARGIGVDVLPYRSLTKDEKRAIEAEAKRYAKFLGAPVALKVLDAMD